MYDVKSPHADDFINDGEVLATLQFATDHKRDRALVEAILDKAEKCRGLNHREALVLLDCDTFRSRSRRTCFSVLPVEVGRTAAPRFSTP